MDEFIAEVEADLSPATPDIDRVNTLISANRDVLLAEAYLRSALTGLEVIADFGISDKSIDIRDIKKAINLITEDQEDQSEPSTA